MRLIDADEFYKKLIILAEDDWNKETGTTWSNAFVEIAEMVEDAPTVDVVPVVRCKDCFICETRQTANYLPFLYCELHDCSVLGDFYCSWGERRECDDTTGGRDRKDTVECDGVVEDN